MTRDDVPRAMELREKGWSLEEIGAYFGVSNTRAWRLMRQHPDYEPQRPGRKYQIDSRQVLDLLEGGFKPAQIAHLLGYSRPTVYRALWREGIRFYGPDGVGRSKG